VCPLMNCWQFLLTRNDRTPFGSFESVAQTATLVSIISRAGRRSKTRRIPVGARPTGTFFVLTLSASIRQKRGVRPDIARSPRGVAAVAYATNMPPACLLNAAGPAAFSPARRRALTEPTAAKRRLLGGVGDFAAEGKVTRPGGRNIPKNCRASPCPHTARPPASAGGLIPS